MSGAELRRFVGGPFPNLVTGSAGGRQVRGLVGGPYANLTTAAPSSSGEPTVERVVLDGTVAGIPA